MTESGIIPNILVVLRIYPYTLLANGIQNRAKNTNKNTMKHINMVTLVVVLLSNCT